GAVVAEALGAVPRRLKEVRGVVEDTVSLRTGRAVVVQRSLLVRVARERGLDRVAEQLGLVVLEPFSEDGVDLVAGRLGDRGVALGDGGRVVLDERAERLGILEQLGALAVV